MLLTELILSKRGPLAKVWLSAHHEKKLSKQQALGVDVEESVDAILTQEEGPITLRLSGQLMLGVTRIYSRKVQYLLDDCKETRERISLAFRPGVVDLPEDQSRANPNAITFADLPNDFNFFDWTWAAPPPELASTQVNLRPATKEFGAYNFGRPTAPSIYGRSSTSRHPSQDGDSSSHLDSQDFSGIDLGLDFGDISVEKGRDASVQPAREFSLVPSKRGDSVMPDTDMTFGDVDLGLDFGDYNDFNDMPNDLPVLARSRRETSALSTPPPHSPLEAEVTPRTAKRAAAGPEPKAKRARLLYADAELELPDEDFLPPGENTNLLTEERYIPSDPELIRLRAIVSDPNSYFLPTVKVGNENMIYAGPQDLAPELTELFTFPTNILRRDKQVEDVEAGRRGSMAPPPVDFGNDAFGFDQGGFDQGGFDQDQGLDQTFDAGFDQGMDMGFDQGFNQGLDLTSTPRKERQESVPRAQSVITVVQPDSDADYPLAMFDPRSETQMTQSESQNLRSEDSGYSKNTGMAMGLLRKEIDAIEGASFDLLSQKATKKAASAFFFELLVLGTRDAVKLDQARPFEDIKIQSKPRLFV